MCLGHVQKQPLGVGKQPVVAEVVGHTGKSTSFRDRETRCREFTKSHEDEEAEQIDTTFSIVSS